MRKHSISIMAVFAVVLAATIALGTPLASDRNTPQRKGDRVSLGVGAGQKIYAGALVMRNATGYVSAGTATTGCIGIGRAASPVDNTNGSNGAVTVAVDRGIFRYANSSSSDALTSADIGNTCYIVDDQTVSKTTGSSSRSAAGKVFDVDAAGVWVDFR